MDKEQQIDAVLPHLDEWMNRVLGGFPETADKAYAAAKVARRGIQKIAREALDEPDKAIAASAGARRGVGLGISGQVAIAVPLDYPGACRGHILTAGAIPRTHGGMSPGRVAKLRPQQPEQYPSTDRAPAVGPGRGRLWGVVFRRVRRWPTMGRFTPGALQLRQCGADRSRKALNRPILAVEQHVEARGLCVRCHHCLSHPVFSSTPRRNIRQAGPACAGLFCYFRRPRSAWPAVAHRLDIGGGEQPVPAHALAHATGAGQTGDAVAADA